MPRAVWWEWWPAPTVPVPMARREVLMPVPPSVTVSEAANFCESGGMEARRRVMAWEVSHAPAAAWDERWRKSRRSMGTSGGDSNWDAGAGKRFVRGCARFVCGKRCGASGPWELWGNGLTQPLRAGLTSVAPALGMMCLTRCGRRSWFYIRSRPEKK